MDTMEKLAAEREFELEEAARTSTRLSETTASLARLLSAFDARRRSRETLALRQSARALQELA
jgi:hypothetical protein